MPALVRGDNRLPAMFRLARSSSLRISLLTKRSVARGIRLLMDLTWLSRSRGAQKKTASGSFPPEAAAFLSYSEAVLSALRLMAPPHVDISEPFRTDRPGRFVPVACSAVKGRKPEDQPEEPEPEQRLQAAWAEAGQQPELLSRLCSRLHRNRYRSHRHHSRHSSRQQLRIRTVPELQLPDDEPIGRSQPEHRSELTQHKGCSSSGSCESGRRFHQQLRHEHARQSHSEHRRRRS